MKLLDYAAVVKLSRCVYKEPYQVRVSPEVLDQVRIKCDQKYARAADLINYCLYHFLVEDDDRDLLIKKMKSNITGNIRGNKKDADVEKAYLAQQELF